MAETLLTAATTLPGTFTLSLRRMVAVTPSGVSSTSVTRPICTPRNVTFAFWYKPPEATNCAFTSCFPIPRAVGTLR
ncbi:Uncharacterised protein [Mycobacteroides abscessus]|nr:Uncharacterised protein [Mycobacteroides abscessus]SIK96803.1 Uncharacterised protein [Mycobacteroides abscessus subsp. abscessus]